MSLIMTVYVREGIVMAADSRLTLTIPKQTQGQGGVQQLVSVTSSDSARNVFLADAVGIATYGIAGINGVPLAGFIDSFIAEIVRGKGCTPVQIANELLGYFKKLGVKQVTHFHVAGYAKADGSFVQYVLHVDLDKQCVAQINPLNLQGANWGGEADVLQRLLNQVALTGATVADLTPIPFFGVPFEYFTLQDAIDFAVYGIRSTIDTLRFQMREKPVGGPIDVLVLRPDGARWIAQKQLGVR